ncbi:MAG TPA: TonB-dependent receptor [Polyangia bacterium]|nr:TonB-dependent receptor [Polyangia bacterium]
MPSRRDRTRGSFGRQLNLRQLLQTVAVLGSCGLAAVAAGQPAEVPHPAPAPAPIEPLPSPPPYETVVTAGPPVAQPLHDQAAAATVVLPADSPRARDDLGDLLMEVPGVTITRSGGLGAFATISLRGSNPDEVRIYIDGVPMNVAAGGSVDLSTLPLGDVERVEVYRGTTPIAFAESALGGIISITTRTPGTPHASVRVGNGSFGNSFADASGGGRWRRLRLYAGLHALRASNDFLYRSDNGTVVDPSDDMTLPRQNNQLAQGDGVVRAAIDLPGRREISVGLLGIWRRQGLSGLGIYPTREAAFVTARGLAHMSYESRSDLGDSSRLRAQVFFSAERDEFSDRLREVGGIPAVTHDTIMGLGSTVTAAKTAAPWARLAAIIEGRRETFQPINDIDPTPVGVPAGRLVGAVGAEVDLWWRRLALDIIPSARLETVRDVVTGRDLLFARQRPASDPVVHVLPVLRLGLVRPVSSWMALKANAGRYARVPSFSELYGDSGRQLGNPELRPEVGWNADAGVSFRASGTGADLDARSIAFGARVDDLIGWESTTAGPSRALNLSRARIWGLEQELRVRIGRRFRLTGQATYTDARDVGDVASRRGRQLPAHPRYHAYLRPELRNLFEGRRVVAGAYVEADLSSGAFRDSNNQSPIPTRLLVGGGLLVDVPHAGLRLTVSAQNLGDSRINDITGYPVPGRLVFASLMWSSGFRGEPANSTVTVPNTNKE